MGCGRVSATESEAETRGLASSRTGGATCQTGGRRRGRGSGDDGRRLRRTLADQDRYDGLGDDVVADAAEEGLFDYAETSRAHKDHVDVLLRRDAYDELSR